MPHEHALMLLDHRPHPQTVRHVRAVLIRNELVHAIRPITPTVIRAGDALTLHLSPMPKMSTKMRAMRIQHMQHTVISTVRHLMTPEILERLHTPHRDLRTPPHHEPPGRFPGERNLHGESPQVGSGPSDAALGYGHGGLALVG